MILDAQPPAPVGVSSLFAEKWETILTAATTFLTSSAFAVWWNKHKRSGESQSLVVLLEQMRKNYELLLADKDRIAERERQIGEDFRRLYEERRKELHAVNNQLLPAAVEAERLSWKLQAVEKENSELKVRLAVALEAPGRPEKT